jgi:hypothetical protein
MTTDPLFRHGFWAAGCDAEQIGDSWAASRSFCEWRADRLCGCVRMTALAPIPAVRGTEIERQGSTLSGPSAGV